MTLKKGESGITAYEDDNLIYSDILDWNDHCMSTSDTSKIYVMHGDTLMDPSKFIGMTLSGWKMIYENVKKMVCGLRLMANIE